MEISSVLLTVKLCTHYAYFAPFSAPAPPTDVRAASPPTALLLLRSFVASFPRLFPLLEER